MPHWVVQMQNISLDKRWVEEEEERRRRWWWWCWYASRTSTRGASIEDYVATCSLGYPVVVVWLRKGRKRQIDRRRDFWRAFGASGYVVDLADGEEAAAVAEESGAERGGGGQR